MSQRFHTRDRGAIIPLVALLLPVLMLMTGFAVDLGRQRSSRRDMQAAADVIALDMARLADGRVLSEVQAGSGLQPPAETALSKSAGRNGVDRTNLTLQWGTFDEPTGTFTVVVDDTVLPDAAKVVATESTDYYFQPGAGSVTRQAIAEHGREPRAEFLLGSTLVNVTPNQSWMIGQLLSFIIPEADLLGYEGLANAEVTLADLQAELGVATLEELLSVDVAFRDLLVATADVLERQGNTAGLAVLDPPDPEVGLIDLAADLDLKVNMGELLGVDTTDPQAGLLARVGVPQLLALSALLFGDSNVISIPPSVINMAGLGTIGLTLHVIEAPIRIGTEDGASGTTRQVGVDVTVDLDVNGTKDQRVCELPDDERELLRSLLGGLFALLDCLLTPWTEAPLKVGVNGQIGLGIDIAGVTANQTIDCGNDELRIGYAGSPATIDVTATLTPSVTFDGKPLLNLLGVSVPTSLVTTTETSSGTAVFKPTDAGPVHRAFADVATGEPTARIGAPTLGLANLLQTQGLRVTVVNQDLDDLGAIATGLVQPLVNDIVGTVDEILVSELSRLLGLKLGGGDITPQWMDCDDDGSVQLVE